MSAQSIHDWLSFSKLCNFRYFRYLCCIKWRQQSDRRGRYSFLSSRKLGVSYQESDVELSFMKGNVRRRIPTEQEAIL